MLLLAFLLQEKRLLMSEPKTIYCPKCGRKAMSVDEKSKMDFYSKCKKCNKIVYYHAETKTVEIKNIPYRTCSSGTRFY